MAEHTGDLLGSGLRQIQNVGEPSLTAFLPGPGKANRTAAIVAPGGGFMMLSWDSEGVLVARRLAEAGLAAFVLKYRLVETPADPADFTAALNGLVASAGRHLQPTPEHPYGEPFPGEAAAAEDGAQAVRLVRARAAEWGVDPRRVGFVGFSAGAIIAASIAAGEALGRPDFVGLIYGAQRAAPPKNAPPAFIAAAADDQLLARAQLPLFEAWRKAGAPAELHVFERGGHGFGLVAQGASSDHWFDQFVWWLQARRLLTAAEN